MPQTATSSSLPCSHSESIFPLQGEFLCEVCEFSRSDTGVVKICRSDTKEHSWDKRSFLEAWRIATDTMSCTMLCTGEVFEDELFVAMSGLLSSGIEVGVILRETEDALTSQLSTTRMNSFIAMGISFLISSSKFSSSNVTQ